MADRYTALARGLESGFGMARQAAEDERRARRDAIADERAAAADERAASAEKRAGLRLVVDEQAQARADARLDEQTRTGRADRAAQVLERRRGELIAGSAARQAAGMPVDPTSADEYGQVEQQLKQIRQQALNFASQANSGQVDPMQVPPGELYMHLTAATGMLPEEITRMPDSIAKIQSGMQTGNGGLAVEGANGLLAPQLRRGVGGPSPYGGTIVRKEIIGLDPAQDANGRDHPNRVIPRLRVYVQSEDGKVKHYDAPMTRNGSTDPNDQVVSIDIKRATNYMGNLGMLAQALQDPVLAERVRQGQAEAGAQAKKYLDDLTALGRPQVKGQTEQRIEAIRKFAVESNISFDEAAKRLQSGGILPGARQESDLDRELKQARIDALKDRNENGLLTDEAVDLLAREAVKDKGVLANLGRGTQGANDLRRIVNKMAENARAGGGSIATARADFGAAKKSLDKLVPQYDAITAFENSAIQQGKILIDLAKKVDTTGVPVVERWIRAGRKSVAGDPDVAAFNTQVNLFRTEAARIITNPNLTGALTVYAQQEASKFVPSEASAEQIERVVGLLERDFKVRKSYLEQQINDVRDRLETGRTPGAAPKPATPTATAGASPPAKQSQAPAVGTVMGGYRFKGGDPSVKSNWEKVQ